MREFLQSWEIEFVQSEVHAGAHKRLLVSKLSLKLKSYHFYLITDTTVPYTTLKETLLADTGLTKVEVQNKLLPGRGILKTLAGLRNAERLKI